MECPPVPVLEGVPGEAPFPLVGEAALDKGDPKDSMDALRPIPVPTPIPVPIAIPPEDAMPPRSGDGTGLKKEAMLGMDLDGTMDDFRAERVVILPDGDPCPIPGDPGPMPGLMLPACMGVDMAEISILPLLAMGGIGDGTSGTGCSPVVVPARLCMDTEG